MVPPQYSRRNGIPWVKENYTFSPSSVDAFNRGCPTGFV